jgi:hypothetical protein
MKKLFCFLVTLCMFVFPSMLAAADESTEFYKAAFVRNDDLWIKLGEREKRITDGEYVGYPKWSFDGRWIAYLKGDKKIDFPLYEGDLRLYNIHLGKHVKVSSNVKRDFQWAPNKNLIGFQSDDRLYMTDTHSVNTIHRISSKIKNFSWLPDNEGFITSSKAGEQLDSDIVLSKILIDQPSKHPKTSHFYTIPVAKEEYFISTSPFKWSSDHRWVAFLLEPTASMSADTNTLCVFSDDGKIFKKIGEMLDYDEWFQWAPRKSLLSMIGGGIREATINKQLMVFTPPFDTTNVYTPRGFVDRDLTWLDDNHIITTRSIENEWFDINQRPLPALFTINIKNNAQSKLTTHSSKEGDFRPQQLGRKLFWIQTDRRNADVLSANTDGSMQTKWISNIDLGSWYYEKWHWEEVFSLYVPQ